MPSSVLHKKKVSQASVLSEMFQGQELPALDVNSVGILE